MQLAVTRSQHEDTDRKGRSRGVLFRLDYQLRASPEERSIIERYGLGDRYVVGDFSSSLGHTLERMLKGDTHSGSSTDSVLQFQQLIMKAARTAAALVSQIAAFDGREMILDLETSSESDSA